MSQESMPFFDSAEEATRTAIQMSGQNYKTVGLIVWPQKSADAASSALRNALNENREERLTADQHLLIANNLQRFEFLHYCAHKCGHSRPEQITPEERKAQFEAAFMQTAHQMRELLKRIDDLQQPTKLRVVA